MNHCLWRAGERVFLTPKAFDVLRYLVDHADRLVSQAELLEAVWPETYVNPEGVRKYIQEIRKVLGDRPDQACIHSNVTEARLSVCRAGDRRAARRAIQWNGGSGWEYGRPRRGAGCA